MVSRLLHAEDILLSVPQKSRRRHRRQRRGPVPRAAGRWASTAAVLLLPTPSRPCIATCRSRLYTPDQFDPRLRAGHRRGQHPAVRRRGPAPGAERVDLCIDHHGSNSGLRGGDPAGRLGGRNRRDPGGSDAPAGDRDHPAHRRLPVHRPVHRHRLLQVRQHHRPHPPHRWRRR